MLTPKSFPLPTASGGFAMIAALLAWSVWAEAAQAAPTVDLTFADVAVNAPLAYSYTAAGVPAKAQLVLQRPVGTAKRYGTIATLAKAPNGSGALPAQPKRGLYSYRIAVIGTKRVGKKHHKRKVQVVLAEQRAAARVFGPVTFEDYFDRTPDTTTFVGHSFSYTYHASPDTGRTETLLTVAATENRCRSVHIDWVPVNDDGYSIESDHTAMVSLVQQFADPVSQTASDQMPSAFDATTTPGESWGITAETLTPRNTYMVVYVNGALDCY